MLPQIARKHKVGSSGVAPALGAPRPSRSAPRALALQPTALLYLHVETNKTTTVAVNANAFPSCNLAQKLRWDVFDVVTVVRLDVYCHHAHAGGIPLFQRALWQHHVTSCRTMADDEADVW